MSGAREQGAHLNGFLELVRQLKLAAIVRVLDEHSIQDANGELAKQILDAQDVDKLARDAWANGKRNAKAIGIEVIDRWWQDMKSKQRER